MKKLKNFLKRHQTVAAILVAVLSSLVWAILQTLLNRVNFFDAILDLPVKLLSFVWSFLLLDIPVWAIIIGVGVITSGFCLYVRAFSTSEQEGLIKDYTSDSYKGQKYKWNWNKNQMHDLRPICNDCSGELIPDNLTGYSAWLLCPNCDKRYKMTDETALAHAETYFTNRANRKSEELKQAKS